MLVAAVSGLLHTSQAAAPLWCAVLCLLCLCRRCCCWPHVPQRDVPGMTRAAVPVLASQGVLALTSGVNGFSAPPGVPKVTGCV